MSRSSYKVMANGIEFSSATKFCNHFGLQYPAVRHHLQEGKTGDEILKILRQNSICRRYSTSPGRGRSVIIDDVEYKSITEASAATGLSTAEINKMLHSDLPKSTGRKVPCTIGGVTYPTREAAAKAYGLPIQTIWARVKRRGISFEEALEIGRKFQNQMFPEKSKWGTLTLSPIDVPSDNDDKDLFSDIASILSTNNFQIQCFCDEAKSVWAVRFQENLKIYAAPLDVYVLFDNNDTTRDIEFVVPKVLTFESMTASKKQVVLDKLNELNAEYNGAKISLVENQIMISWSTSIARKSIPATLFMRILYRFLGTAGVFWEGICWAEDE